MNRTTEGEMNVRRVTLTDGRYLIFYEFSGDLFPTEVADTQSQETQCNRSGESDWGSCV